MLGPPPCGFASPPTTSGCSLHVLSCISLQVPESCFPSSSQCAWHGSFPCAQAAVSALPGARFFFTPWSSCTGTFCVFFFPPLLSSHPRWSPCCRSFGVVQGNDVFTLQKPVGSLMRGTCELIYIVLVLLVPWCVFPAAYCWGSSAVPDGNEPSC